MTSWSGLEYGYPEVRNNRIREPNQFRRERVMTRWVARSCGQVDVSSEEKVLHTHPSRPPLANGISSYDILWPVAVAFLLLTGCAVGPKYKRPPVTAPDTYRGVAPEADSLATASIGDEKWWTVYQDPQLQALIKQALDQNYDLRIAATRVLQARALLGITRADQFPTITGGASAANVRIPRTKQLPEVETSSNEVTLS